MNQWLQILIHYFWVLGTYLVQGIKELVAEETSFMIDELA